MQKYKIVYSDVELHSKCLFFQLRLVVKRELHLRALCFFPFFAQMSTISIFLSLDFSIVPSDTMALHILHNMLVLPEPDSSLYGEIRLLQLHHWLDNFYMFQMSCVQGVDISLYAHLVGLDFIVVHHILAHFVCEFVELIHDC